MSEHPLSGRLAALPQARQHLDVAWDDVRARRAASGLPARLSSHRRSQRLRQGGLALLVAGALAASVLGGQVGGPRVPAQRDEPAAPGGSGGLTLRRLADGSRLESLTPATVLQTEPEQAGEQRVQLARGRARFTVASRPDRRFVVRSGAVEVVVVGTRFVVERDGDRVRVSVEEGRVRVKGPDGRARLLGAGESSDNPAALPPVPPPAAEAPPEAAPVEPGPAPGEPPAPAAPVRPVKVPPPAERAPVRVDWRELARTSPGPEALDALQAEGLERLRGPVDLLLAADLGRATRSHALAERALGLLLERHPADARAPLAAFTLGRLLIERQGRPAEAAAAFARARQLAPRGPLAADALAREIECWARAGRTAVARERAAEYLRAHPAGPHRRAVEAHLGPGAPAPAPVRP